MDIRTLKVVLILSLIFILKIPAAQANIPIDCDPSLGNDCRPISCTFEERIACYEGFAICQIDVGHYCNRWYGIATEENRNCRHILIDDCIDAKSACISRCGGMPRGL